MNPMTPATAPGTPPPAGAVPIEGARRQPGRTRSFLGQVLRRNDGRFGVLILVMFTVLALFPDLFVGKLETATTATGQSLQPPGGGYLFGTDELGRDVFNMTVHGARISMAIGLMATMITVLFGALLGIIAGYVGGRVDTVIMRISDFFLVLPTIVLAIILAPVILDVVGADAELFGIRATMIVIVVVIGLTSWAVTARIIRSQVLSIKMRMFVDRARVVGSGPGRIMRVHVLPNVINLIVAQAVLTFAVAVFTETTLAFIGLGDPFAPSWGQILNAAQSAGAPGLGAWWYIVPPAVCVVLVVLAFTLVGNALDDVLNPKSGTRR
jgi:peptide/nickel transport system permease protein